METNKKLVDKKKYCKCGNTSKPHRFRHKFKEHHIVERYIDVYGDSFILNANDFETKTEEGRCSIPECTADKVLHGSVIKHEFKPVDGKTYRSIEYRLPLDTICRYCQGTVEKHENLDHPFHTIVEIKNRETSDVVNIVCRDKVMSERCWSNHSNIVS